MRWVLLLLPLILLVACGGSSEEAPTPSPPAQEPTAEQAQPTPDEDQALYNEFLETSREFARKTPLISCDPAFWGVQIDLLAIGEPTHRGLAELSIIDACLEVGELSHLTTGFSEYYANAPKP